MATKTTYGLTDFLREVDTVYRAAKRDALRLGLFGYTAADLGAFAAARKAVGDDRKTAGEDFLDKRGHRAQLSSLRDEAHDLVVHARGLVAAGLLGGDFGLGPAHEADRQRAHDLVGIGLPVANHDALVESEGTRVLAALDDRAVAACLKRRGWTAADTARLQAAVDALDGASKDRVDHGALDGDMAELARVLSYARTIGHLAWKHNPAKLADYKVSKKAQRALRRPGAPAAAASA